MKTLLKYFGILAGLASVLALIFIVGFIFLLFAIQILPFRGEEFNSEAWTAAIECRTDTECAEKHTSCVRGAMYSDLVDNYLLIGTDEETMVSLLGQYEAHRRNTSCVEYKLGACSGFIDDDYMVVCFDRHRKIIDVSHYQR